MKILILFTYNVSLKNWEYLGIIEREVLLYKKLSKKGINYTFLTYGDQNDLKYKQLLDNIEIIPISQVIKSRYLIIKLIKSFFLPKKLKNIFKNVDIIKTNQVEGCWVAFLAKILYKKKILIRAGYEWLRNFLSKSEIQKNSNLIKYIINYFYIYIIEFVAYRIADRIILTNKQDLEFIIKTFRLKKKSNKIKVIPNYVNTDLFKPLKTERNNNSFLYVGRLIIEKNLINLFNAFKELKEYTLDIVGIGPQYKELIDIKNENKLNINFLGKIPNNQLPQIINKYDIFILPSLYEGNPKALLESMSCGLPCIGTNVRGIKDIIKHKINGYLCGTDSNSIKSAILDLFNDTQLRKNIGETARKFIIKNNSLDLTIKKEYFLYKEMLKGIE